MVPAEEPERAAVLHLVAEEEQRALEPVRATVNVVAEEEVADVAGAAALVEDAEQVRVLAVDVADKLHGRGDLEEHGLREERGLRCPEQRSDVALRDRRAARPGEAEAAGGPRRHRRRRSVRPEVEELVDHRVDHRVPGLELVPPEAQGREAQGLHLLEPALRLAVHRAAAHLRAPTRPANGCRSVVARIFTTFARGARPLLKRREKKVYARRTLCGAYAS
mmetsp:Transcript_29647/g.96957  ORF Transcript_29647/g.96957 Transcript_29647/m.96957 type:complete len:221 (+) Transcript_29647:656-1318(+)